MRESAVVAQVARLSDRYEGVAYDSHARTVRMRYRLDASFDDCWIVEDFSLRIVLGDGYPHEVPTVYEESCAIPDEFEHRYDDGSLCIGVPGEVLMMFPGGIELLELIEGPVTSCLYSAAFLRRYGRYPFGERSHGIAGILEYYRELFGVRSDQAAVSLMRFISERKRYRGSDRCPCGSGKQVWTCHGKTLNELSSEAYASAVAGDYNRISSEVEAYENVRNMRTWIRETVRANSGLMWEARS